MKARRKQTGKKTKKKIIGITAVLIGIAFFGAALFLSGMIGRRRSFTSPEELLGTYMDAIPEKNYEKMYGMLNVEASGGISEEAFTERNSAIYEGMEVRNMKTEILSFDAERNNVSYRTSFDTAAGTITFENRAHFVEGEDGYGLAWDDSLIFPELLPTDKVRVSTARAERGEILDRHDRVLAGKGTASSVGIVPGRLEDGENAVSEIAELLEMEPEAIEKKLSAKWVKDDYFVPIKTLPKLDELSWMSPEPDAGMKEEASRQERLLAIPGVMISDTEVREYPLGAAAAHLIGYIQSVTAEDLEEHGGEGYTANSVIGRSGMEGLFEKELKGQNGCRISIVDSEGMEKAELARKEVQDGQNIKLTIDGELQKALYEEFQEDKGCCAAINPYTGEVLALVSTPSYDTNDFILGMSNETWNSLNEDERMPLYNRFRQTWCPGSSLKPVIASIGLDSGAINPAEDYGREGLRWQNDESWGSYYVTTLHEYEPVTLENALIYSDNIYFAKAALRIGAEELQNSLQRLGFGEQLPFDIQMTKSRYSNSGEIESEIQLADSGYGQGQMLVNPLHMACLYSAFANEGNVVNPYLVYQEEANAKYWILGAFSADTANTVLEGMKKVVNDPNGTGYGAHREDIVLAGKTGTAEIKESKDDTTGTELGWFVVLSADRAEQNPILLVSMTEDVKDRGGSGYVVERDSRVLEAWFSGRSF